VVKPKKRIEEERSEASASENNQGEGRGRGVKRRFEGEAKIRKPQKQRKKEREIQEEKQDSKPRSCPAPQISPPPRRDDFSVWKELEKWLEEWKRMGYGVKNQGAPPESHCGLNNWNIMLWPQSAETK
jgi:hypothetical protein